VGDRRSAGAAAPRQVRPRPNGKKIVTDGPFAETKEVVGGFDIIECGSLEEAVEMPLAPHRAEFGTIEVRPFLGQLAEAAGPGGVEPPPHGIIRMSSQVPRSSAPI
jgi:hypothetical protein